MFPSNSKFTLPKPPLGSPLNLGHWPTQELIYYSPFFPANEIVDYTTNKNHATIDGATWTGEGLSFDGTNDFAHMPVVAPLLLSNSFTITMRIRVDTAADNDGILSGHNAGLTAPIDFICGVLVGGDDLFLQILEGSNPFITAPFTKNKWISVAYVLDSSNDGFIYIDGEEAVTGALEAITPSMSNLVWGNYDLPDATFAYHGDISHTSIYNRVLTVSEIQQLHLDPHLPIRNIDNIMFGSFSAAAPTGVIPQIMYNRRLAS